MAEWVATHSKLYCCKQGGWLAMAGIDICYAKYCQEYIKVYHINILLVLCIKELAKED